MALVRVRVVEEKDDESNDDVDDDVYDVPRKKQLELVRCNLSQHRQLLILQHLHQKHYLWNFDVLEEMEDNVLEDVDYFQDHKLIDIYYQNLLVMI